MRELPTERLDNIVSLVTDKTTGRKDPAKPYLGLEHLPSMGSSVLGSSPAEDSVSINNKFRAGDILFGKLRPRLRKCVRVDFDGYCSTDILVLRATSESHPSFAGFIFQSDAVSSEAIRAEEGTKMPRCSWGVLRKLRVFCPDSGTQRRIAEVLATIDEAISQTEALVAKTQQIKAGLMHDLFARGVLPDGQLRPARDKAPKLYKDSSIGWIPKEWDIRQLRSCLLDNPTNGIYKPAHLIGRGTLLIGQAAFTAERSIDFALSRRAVVSDEELQRYGVAAGNILVSRVFATVEGVGLPTLVPDLPEPAVYESNMMRLRVNQKAIRPRLLFEWLRGRCARQRIEGGVNASNQASVNQGVLNPLPVPWQPAEEQDRLVRIVEEHDEKHAAEQATLAKLQSVKRGLMEDLLSGRVRVPVADARKVAANV